MTTGPTATPTPASMVAPAKLGWRVVIIDDSPDDRAEIRRLLLKSSERRFHFVEAETGEAGVRAVLGEEARPPDCVVLDYHLPDLDALEVLAAITGPGGVPVCPVVVLTGSAAQEVGRAVLRGGAQDFLGKGSMTPESLGRAIENAAERWAMACELRERAMDLRRAEAATRESEARLRLALEASATGLWTWDLGTDAVTWSLECHQIHGVPEGAFGGTGVAFFQLVHADDRARVEATVRAAIADHSLYECEFRVVRPSGEVVWVENRGRVRSAGEGAPKLLGTIADITDRKRAEAQLRRNAESFHQLIQNNPFGVYVVDADLRMRQVSLGAQKAFANVHPLIGRDFAEVIRIVWPEPFATDVISRFRHTLTTGEPYTAASTVERRRDIEETEAYDWRIERVTLPEGRDGVVCYFYDLSERQRWEAALTARERELQSLADNSPDVLTRFDRELRHVFVNAAVETATGRPRSEFIGKTNRDLGMPTALCDQWEAATRYVFDRGEHKSLEFSYESADGLRHYAVRLVPEFAADGTVEFVLGVTHDVTDRRRAEAEVRAGEERLRMALAAAQAGVWAWEVATGAVAWSPENYALHGYDPASGPPAYADWGEGVHPDDRKRVDAAVADAVAGRTPEFRSEFRVVHPTRGDRWLLGLGRVEFAATGAPVRMVGINLDITDRKRTEQALAEQDVRKDEFLATLAHELRNPLAPIRSGVAVLRMTCASDQSDQTEKMLGVIDRQLGHMVNLVDDLLDVSRVRTGKITLRTERVTIREAVDAAVEACRPTIDAKRHALEMSFPAEPLAVAGDKTRLVQVVANLLTNAAKYSEPGGRIQVTVGRDGGEVLVRVSDTGMGIARETLPTLWDMFTQVRDTLDKAQGGLGIGLSLVKKLVEMHGGTVAAESAGVGHGSTFTVRLPLAAGSVAAASPPASEHHETARPAARRVLVVDDNVDGAESLAMLLEISGHVTQTAHTGQDALAAAKRSDLDVVFLDIGLPAGMDGFEVARRLRADPDTAGVVLVALTGWGSEEDKQKSKDAGFDFHLTKPIEVAAIQGILAGLSPAHGGTTGGERSAAARAIGSTAAKNSA